MLVDMPGFNSPLDAHNKAIDRYIGDGVHYLFVVSVEEGALHQQIISNMDQVTVMERGFTVCINKADLKPAADVQGICDYIPRTTWGTRALRPRYALSARTTLRRSRRCWAASIPRGIFGAIFENSLLGHNQYMQGILDTALKGLEAARRPTRGRSRTWKMPWLLWSRERQQQSEASQGGNLEGLRMTSCVRCATAWPAPWICWPRLPCAVRMR